MTIGLFHLDSVTRHLTVFEIDVVKVAGVVVFWGVEFILPLLIFIAMYAHNHY